MMLCGQNKNADRALSFSPCREICLLLWPPDILSFGAKFSNELDTSRAGHCHPGGSPCISRAPLFPGGALPAFSWPWMARACHYFCLGSPARTASLLGDDLFHAPGVDWLSTSGRFAGGDPSGNVAAPSLTAPISGACSMVGAALAHF